MILCYSLMYSIGVFIKGPMFSSISDMIDIKDFPSFISLIVFVIVLYNSLPKETQEKSLSLLLLLENVYIQFGQLICQMIYT